MYRIAERVGSVFLIPRTLFFYVDSDSEIAFGIENEALPPKELAGRVEQTTKELHIEALRGRNIFELSGGEKQKMAFASVYAMNPVIYLLDEPSSNLDMSAVRELREHLGMIKAQGKTILIAEHRLHYLMDIADRIVYMADGQIAGIYTPKEIRSLSVEARKRMGLRAVDLNEETPGRRLADKRLSSRRLEDKRPADKIPADRRRFVLELRNVSLFYKKQTVLEHLNFLASPGEVIAVVGQNGAGKTTFSRALCGLHKSCRGEFLWKQAPQNHKNRLKLSYLVMQDVNYELFAKSVEEECSFGIKNPEKCLIEQTMDTLGLTPFRERHPNTLSGGQKQRVAAAVSMICGKELLVFDEPTSGLDYDSMAQVAHLIGELSASGKLIFVVTHDYEFVCRTCTRVLHFDEGEMTDDLSVTPENLSKLKELFAVSGRKGDEI